MSCTEDVYFYYLDSELNRCRKWIEDALEYSGGTHDFDDIYQGVMRGLFQFWPREDACAVTEILNYPKKKVLHIFLAGGNMETIVGMDKDAEELAKRRGCDSISIAGRKGWQKVLSSNGYEPSFITLGRNI
jgi:hypothetical protein